VDDLVESSKIKEELVGYIILPFVHVSYGECVISVVFDPSLTQIVGFFAEFVTIAMISEREEFNDALGATAGDAIVSNLYPGNTII